MSTFRNFCSISRDMNTHNVSQMDATRYIICNNIRHTSAAVTSVCARAGSIEIISVIRVTVDTLARLMKPAVNDLYTLLKRLFR